MLAKIYLIILSLIIGQSSWAQDSVLVLGDSHTYGFFGDALEKGLAKNYTVTRVGSCGARAEAYFADYTTKCGLRWTGHGKDISQKVGKTPRLTELIQTKPQHVVIALGTNYLFSTEKQIEKEVQQMLSALPKTASCHWLGAPDIQSSERKAIIAKINAAIKASLAKSQCTFMDISKLVSYPAQGGDGIHFSKSGGESLGLKSAEEVIQSLARQSEATKSKSQKLPTKVGPSVQ